MLEAYKTRRILIACTAAILLSATITCQSLWTDEAFSAYIASHRSVATAWSTLIHGDSSDLQMVLYYLYLHGWSQLFGQSEVAFRSANIPFIFLYVGMLVWASQRLFGSSWVWIIAALSPLAVAFASDTRPYFDVIAINLAGLTFLVACLQSPSDRERKLLPWLMLVALMLGALFHMLTLLLCLPLLVVVIVFRLNNPDGVRWRDWKWPLLALTPLGVALLGYFVWTFHRGIGYSYAKPDLASMGSVIFRFVGLSGYAPNRRYDLPFRPYLLAMALSGSAFAMAIGALLMAARKSRERILVLALLCALATGVAEVFILSFALKQQIEFRHLSCLLPLLLLMVMAGATSSAQGSRQYTKFAAAAVVAAVWMISDINLLFSPNHQREDFRSAVSKCLALRQSYLQEGKASTIVVAADPIAPAYYGLDMGGTAPCFPLTDSCHEDLAKVPWAKRAAAQYGLSWSDAQIETFLKQEDRTHSRVILLISRARHPMMKNSAWWSAVSKRSGVQIYPQFGFFVYDVP